LQRKGDFKVTVQVDNRTSGHSDTSDEPFISVVATEDVEAGICGPNTTSGTLAPSTGTQRSTTQSSTSESRSMPAAAAAAAAADNTTSTQRVTASHT